ncbi:class A beta-lactamase-related serine hydrolase [Oleiharenicola lentus]|jgi:CubicO group peptidase (beta-lactamase class C family)|uniref:Class A beta-lactamase-related serine hydrolase n=1 Tax=Oleiharenicola lentus TaxID=2508720 RepID=A0A4Q1C4B9_9BACT|nr:serine hydrolase domain-containing protein [Oleiharenicola lentus]RXK53237.1 class A beta-lactamase-related serine hydrolase [Oleiharenicola lentus]
MFFKPQFYLSLFVFLAGPILFAENTGPQTVEELRQAIEKVLKERQTPGAAVAIVSRDKIEWMAGLGLADEAANQPVTTKTIFRIGSTSKEFVALAALKLQEEGKLKLTDTLRQWVPEYPVENAWESTDPVRLVHLLEQTSGIPDCRFSEYAHNDSTPVTLAQALNFAPQYRVIRWRPGSRYAYSSVGPALVAAVIEKASGQRFEDYVRDNFFVPLQMHTASYFLTPEVQSNLTTMYWSRSHKVASYSHLIYRPSGAVNASVEDMANYVRFHLMRGSFDGRQILREASIDRLEVPTTLPSAQAGVTVGYGLYNRAMFSRGYEWHGHNGNHDACFVTMEYCPELGIGLVVMLNSNNVSAFARVNNLVRLYAMRHAPEKASPPAGPMPAIVNQDFNGLYANIAPRDEGYRDFMEYFGSIRKIRVEEKEMIMMRGALRWVPVSGNLFRLHDGAKPELAVITGENGETLLQCYLGTFRRISKFGFWSVQYGMLYSFGILLSSVLFAVVWGLRLAFGRLKNAGPLGPRTWPLVGVVGIVGFIAFYLKVQEGHIHIVGTMNIWSVGLMLDTLLIPLSATFCVAGLWRHRKTPMNRVAYWHAVLVTLGLVFITGFGLAWGLIGIRTWA